MPDDTWTENVPDDILAELQLGLECASERGGYHPNSAYIRACDAVDHEVSRRRADAGGRE